MDAFTFSQQLAQHTDSSEMRVNQRLSSWMNVCLDIWAKGDEIVLPGLGTFAVHREMEYIVEHPTTKERTLYPPRLELALTLQTDFMDGKLSISKEKLRWLVPLAEKWAISIEDTESFVTHFLSLLRNTLIRERYVKVHAWGTFKLWEEKDKLPEVTFRLEKKAYKALNRPFACFEPVLLREGVSFTEPLFASPIEEKEEVNAPPLIEEPQKDNTTKEDTLPPPIAPVSHSVSRKERSHRNEMWKGIGIGLLCALFIASGYYFFSQKETTKTPPVNTSQQAPSTQEVIASDTLDTETIQVEEEADTPTVYDAQKRYVITGTQGIDTLDRGETLARLADKYYGIKDFWVYIAEHNAERIKDPNNIPLGTVLSIPTLREKSEP